VNRKDVARRGPRIDEEGLTAWHTLADEDDLTDVALTGDFSTAELSLVTLQQSRVDGAAFTGTRLVRAIFVDCVIADAEWSAAVLEDCRFERVEFRRCRMAGLQGAGSRFTDVAFLDCKVDGANLRMTQWEAGEFRDSSLRQSDFYGAVMPSTRMTGCDLTDVDFSKADLVGSHLQGSRLDGVRGGDALRGVSVGSDQLIPAALAVFEAMDVTVTDD